MGARGELRDLDHRGCFDMTKEQIKHLVAILWDKYIPLPSVNDQLKGKEEEKIK